MTKLQSPITETTHVLPFNKLPPRDFERLCLWLVEREGYERAEHLGAAGSEQGRDIVAWREGTLWAFQCKRVRSFGPKDALAEVEKVLALPEDQRPAGLVFLVTCDVSVNTRQRVRDRCAGEMECHFWAGTELDEKVKRHPDMVEEFFQADQGNNATPSLKNGASQRLWQQFHHGTSVDDVLQSLVQLDNLVQTSEVSVSNAYDLRVDAFRTLQELTTDDPNRAEQLILDHLLPYCLERATDAPQEVRYARSRCRECLAEWLNQYPEAERTVLRDKVLDRLHLALELAEPEGACWTISTIGFRRPDIVEALWQVVKRYDNRTGDTALSTLTALGVPPNERLQVLSALHQRAAERCNVELVGALRQLADPESLDVVLKYWLQPDNVEAWTRYSFSALHVLTDVADTVDTDPDLQDRVWQMISDLFEAHTDELTPALYLGRDIAPRCNSVNVVPTMLKWLSKEAEDSERSAHNRYLLCLRLEQCVRPRQLKGWENADEPVALLRQDASQDTQYKGRATTSEMMQKEIAWKTLLRLGHADVLTWFEESVATETNPFLRQKISEFLACFRLDPVPSTALRWVTEPYNVQPDNPSGEWVPRMAAIRIARSAASWEAFEALRKFGLTYDGKILQQSGDALAEVAVALAKAGETSVVDALVETVANSTEVRHRTVAAAALQSMAAEDLLPTEQVPRLAELLVDEGRDPYERSGLVAALGYSKEELAPGALQHMRTWALNRDDWLGGRSLETLARHGHLLDEPHLLTECLGLQKIGETWDLSLEANRIGWAAFIIGLLYLRHPAKFTPAIASSLRTQDWHSAVQVIRLLNHAHGKPDQPSLPTEIKEALIERTHQRQTRTSTETGIFRVLARLASDAMAQQPWDQIWNDWLPDARAALADALGEATYAEPEASSKAISLLLSLTRDSKYAVRRSAYRGLARQSAVSLEAMCFAWAEAATMELRQRAAEACAWLALSEGQPDAFGELYQRLAADPEADVRQTAERARRERRDRMWAEEYLSRVRRVEGKTNDEILSAWRYGQALTRVGDDACLRTLRIDLATRTLPPHVRYWFQKIIEDMEKHWREETQKWPEPWLTWEGTVEEGQGTAVLSDGQIIQVSYSLWEQPAPAPSEKHSWGGAMWPITIPTQLEISEFTVCLKDGRQGTALATKVSGGVTIFSGRGPYPA